MRWKVQDQVSAERCVLSEGQAVQEMSLFLWVLIGRKQSLAATGEILPNPPHIVHIFMVSTQNFQILSLYVMSYLLCVASRDSFYFL